MNRKGFIFSEIIISIFLIGLATIFFLPLFGDSLRSFKIIEIRQEMNYLCEYIYERLNSKDEYTVELLNELKDEMEFTDLKSEYIERYKCRVINMDKEEYLWNLKIIIESRKTREEINHVEIYGTIPK